MSVGASGKRTAALAMIGPASWGTTYIVTTELLPPGRPLLAATLRALPAGLLLLAVTRSLPRGSWWWRSTVLGMLNFGAFFPLMFIGAYRLPGGVAATVTAIQPLLVTAFAAVLLGVRSSVRTVAAGVVGAVGVALMVLSAQARLDSIGVAAQVTAIAMMGLGVVLAKRWGRPPGVSLLAFTAWQLTVGGLALVPVMLVGEGVPGHLTPTNLAAFGYLCIIGTAVAYALWFHGIERLPTSSVSFLGLANPVVATLAGVIWLDQSLSGWQLFGLALVPVSIAMGQDWSMRRRAAAAPAFPPPAEARYESQ
ncbi:EamA family transporter [Streptomyces sp. NPDC055815]